jgi:hypothetical protein
MICCEDDETYLPLPFKKICHVSKYCACIYEGDSAVQEQTKDSYFKALNLLPSYWCTILKDRCLTRVLRADGEGQVRDFWEAWIRNECQKLKFALHD